MIKKINYKLYCYIRKLYFKIIYSFKKKTEYSLTITELICREDINPKYFGFMKKMTDEEIQIYNKETDQMLYEKGQVKKFPDWNAAQLAMLINRDILFELFNMAKDKIKLNEYYKKPINKKYYTKINLN